MLPVSERSACAGPSFNKSKKCNARLIKIDEVRGAELRFPKTYSEYGEGNREDFATKQIAIFIKLLEIC
jgi:hypothetical protein